MSRPGLRVSGGKWKGIRARQLSHFPLCAECERKGYVTVADEVDHIKRLEDGGDDLPSNLQSLCHTCHAEKTAKESGRTLRPDPGCDVHGLPLNPAHPWRQ